MKALFFVFFFLLNTSLFAQQEGNGLSARPEEIKQKATLQNLTDTSEITTNLSAPAPSNKETVPDQKQEQDKYKGVLSQRKREE